MVRSSFERPHLTALLLTCCRTLATGVDDRLDLISVHERLRTLFQGAAGSVRDAHGAPASVEENVEFATLQLAPNLADFPALRAVRLLATVTQLAAQLI